MIHRSPSEPINILTEFKTKVLQANLGDLTTIHWRRTRREFSPRMSNPTKTSNLERVRTGGKNLLGDPGYMPGTNEAHLIFHAHSPELSYIYLERVTQKDDIGAKREVLLTHNLNRCIWE